MSCPMNIEDLYQTRAGGISSLVIPKDFTATILTPYRELGEPPI